MRIVALLSVILLGASCAFFSARASELPSIETLAQSPHLADAQMSPTGGYFAARVSQGDLRAFSLYRLQDGALEPLFQAVDTEDVFVQWSRWISDDALLLRIGRYGGSKVSVYVDGERERMRPYFASNLFVLTLDSLGEDDEKPLRRIAEESQLVSILPSDPDHILVEKWSGCCSREVYKVNIRADEKPVRVQDRIRNVYSWTADRNGNVRVGYGADSDNNRVLVARLHGEEEYQDLSHLVDDVDKRFYPLAFTEDLNRLYVGSNHETDTIAVYIYDLATNAFVEQVYHNPDFDVSSIDVGMRTGALRSVSFEASGTETVYFDPLMKGEISKLERNFPDSAVYFSSFSDNADFGIVSVSAPNFPEQLYVYDREGKKLHPLPEQYPGLPPDVLGDQFADSYPSRDGLSIPAYVTLPPGLDSLKAAKNIPFIIMPHGGPAHRDFAGFDIWAQSYAMLGYGVLQMNFRGSTGYGLEFEKAGRRQWGETMQDDITDGVRWLIEEGMADPERIAIVGASYGGYAALMGVIKTPELYQCAVAFAGVTNLFDLLKYADRDSYVVRLIGDRFQDDEDLEFNSPLFRDKDVGRPVMLIHGRLDGVVPFEHSENFYTRLKFDDKPVEFVQLPRTGHGLNDYDDRLRFYDEQRRYIHGCMGGEE